MAAISGSLVSKGSSASLAVTLPALVVVLVIASAVVMPTLVVEVSRADFVLVTLFLGGGAAWLTGRSIATTWRPYRQAVLYALLLGCVVRFFHYALFEGTLLSLHYFVTDTAFLVAIATLGFRAERARQMATRYGWIYRQSGFFGWLEGGDSRRSGDA
ncbi:hypothetical protein EV667_2667 [Ancylobacter aquaticus]|uniref:DUF6867 domain-containing protein n=2 Tax=Ancylobacter aquaticus TaxID=100 RepID=A0A4R1I1M0_ANCAQ|nr:hypothetical protein EV667_2667 [Ancylobacter aquaticus]